MPDVLAPEDEGAMLGSYASPHWTMNPQRLLSMPASSRAWQQSCRSVTPPGGGRGNLLCRRRQPRT
eukprot:12969-Eustigmatos_ZCMA.PRE.1